MSAQGDIATYLQSLSPEGGKDFIPITAEQVAQKTGVSRDKVNKTFYNLMTRGRIELVRRPLQRTGGASSNRRHQWTIRSSGPRTSRTS